MLSPLTSWLVDQSEAPLWKNWGSGYILPLGGSTETAPQLSCRAWANKHISFIHTIPGSFLLARSRWIIREQLLWLCRHRSCFTWTTFCTDSELEMAAWLHVPYVKWHCSLWNNMLPCHRQYLLQSVVWFYAGIIKVVYRTVALSAIRWSFVVRTSGLFQQFTECVVKLILIKSTCIWLFTVVNVSYAFSTYQWLFKTDCTIKFALVIQNC